MRLWSIAASLLVVQGVLLGCTAPRSGLDRADVPGVFCQANLLADLNNCGRCGNVCALDNANATCRDGVCRVESCASNFSDCDNRPDNGCEVSLLTDNAHCGVCDSACNPANGTGTCSMGRCMVTGCSMGFGDCDLLQSTGCESNTQTSLSHCGACGRACAPSNATGRCMAGQCGVAECNAGFANCDMNSENGCESNALNDTNNCGACGHRCSMGQQCIRGRCSGDVVQLAIGRKQSCLLLGDGSVSCVGATDSGALGAPGPAIASETPIAVSGLVGAVEIGVGDDFGCARLANGDVGCWGRNVEGQLGLPARQPADNAFAMVAVGSPTQAIAVGESSVCVLQVNGRIRCWGANDSFQLGFGPMAARVPMPTLVDLTQLGPVGQVAVGVYHSCAISTVSSAVRCWGRNEDGQAGQPTSGPGAMLLVGEPPPNSVLTGASSVAVGLQNSCAIIASDESVRCWGNNRFGQLANNGPATSAPQGIQGLSGVKTVGVGDAHVCALKRNGTVWCWGLGSAGQLGLGTNVNSSTPTQVPTIADAVSLSVGRNSTCVLRANNRVTCWGEDGVGQLGSGRTLFYETPQAIGGLVGTVTDISAGATQTCANTTDGMGNSTVYCWGRNTAGSIGDGTTIPRATPTPLPGVSLTPQLGGFHACAGGASPTCWGLNSLGQLGSGNLVGSNAPRLVSFPLRMAAATITAGENSSCATLVDQSAFCWGENRFGQLGIGGVDPAQVPTLVFPMNSVNLIKTGPTHTCARRAPDSSLICWGRAMFGELGDGTLPGSPNRLTPANSPVQLGAPVSVFDVGSSFSCARLNTNGNVVCWGLNDLGQLGNGQNTNSSVPTLTSPAISSLTLSVGSRFACAIVAGAAPRLPTVQCWGANTYRQLAADNTMVSLSRTPVTIPGIQPAVAPNARLAVGNDHACVLANDGRVYCWGRNLENQIADGVPSVRLSPSDAWLFR